MQEVLEQTRDVHQSFGSYLLACVCLQSTRPRRAAPTLRFDILIQTRALPFPTPCHGRTCLTCARVCASTLASTTTGSTHFNQILVSTPCFHTRTSCFCQSLRCMFVPLLAVSRRPATSTRSSPVRRHNRHKTCITNKFISDTCPLCFVQT